ncbi:Lrp/AsnC family transcriptional regulator [Actinopolymorpha rutila]|uniref:DNA-binding Lrp family transcriptional regulator n=1 Tax=Actinopolymorpha rutila TaxID=446787 RepID=A0A852ZHY4_9ACTN|nr:DNA-binding Lrp family transcriptional regulator [Actinopolymorpha rutila]
MGSSPQQPTSSAGPSAAPVDELDARIVRLFAAEPRIGVLEASRRLGVARGTVQARLDRLARTGVVRGWGPEVEPAALGYGVTAFASLELRQGAGHEAVARHLAGIPEVLEAHTITGPADMLARLVARSNADLQRVIDEVLAFDGIVRISTVIALATQVRPRVVPLLSRAAEDSSGPAQPGV